MSIKIVNGMAIPNMPWEECPKGFNGPIWRYSKNPVINRHPNSVISRAFNSALVPFNGEFVGVFRGDNLDDIPHLYVGHSKDGIHIDISEEQIHFVDKNGNPLKDTNYQYDPRVIMLEGSYYLITHSYLITAMESFSHAKLTICIICFLDQVIQDTLHLVIFSSLRARI